jgi:hypothetical protein
MPSVAQLRTQDEEAGGPALQPFDIPLYLPSEVVNKLPCDRTLLEFEWSLREAEALDALSDLRQHLLCRSHLWYDRAKNVRGQREGMRSWATLDTLKRRVDTDAAHYRAARKALLALSGHLDKGESWKLKFQELHEDDMKGLTVDENEGTEGTVITTWIWKVPGLAEDNSAELQEGMY